MSKTPAPTQYFGDVYYNPDLRVLMNSEGEKLELRPQSLKVFLYLAEHAGQVVGKEDIFAAVWKDVSVTDDSLVQCVAEIRRVLGDSQHRLLKTAHKYGYILTTNRLQKNYKQSKNITLRGADNIHQHYQLPVPNPYTEKPSIAVMDFDHFGQASQEKLFARGLGIDIHANLAKTSHLFVISQHSMGALKSLSPPEVGERLGIAYLVTGIVQQTPNQVRVTINLIECQHNKVIWSEQYNHSLTDFLELQGAIAQAVVNELDTQLEQEEIRRVFSIPTENLNAWETYHRGVGYTTQTDQAGIETSFKLFLRAIELDPCFARPYAGLAITCNHRIYMFGSDIESHAHQGVEYAYKSIELDNHEPWGYWALGRLLFTLGRHEEAEQAIDRAIQLKPNFSWAYYVAALVMSHCEKAQTALTSVDKAMRLSPYDPAMFGMLSTKALAYLASENYEQAAAWGRRAANHPKAYHLTHAMAAICLQMAGYYPEARLEMAQVYQTMPDFTPDQFTYIFPPKNPQSDMNQAIIRCLHYLCSK